MQQNRHLDVDTLAALVLGALGGRARKEAEAHLATGCAACLRDRSWVERILDLVHADQSMAPPPDVLARALGLSAALPQRSALHSLVRRLRAQLLFDSRGRPALADARGSADMVRQLLYSVSDPSLEIDLQLQRQAGPGGSLDLRGQIFPQDEESVELTGCSVALIAAAGVRQTAISALGAFHFEALTEVDQLLLRLPDCEIEVPVPPP